MFESPSKIITPIRSLNSLAFKKLKSWSKKSQFGHDQNALTYQVVADANFEQSSRDSVAAWVLALSNEAHITRKQAPFCSHRRRPHILYPKYKINTEDFQVLSDCSEHAYPSGKLFQACIFELQSINEL